jgi:hypothetical protein
MGAPRIGYENFFALSGSVVTASSEASGFPKENAYDWNTVDGWSPTAAGTAYLTVDRGSADVADYFALVAHTLADVSGTVKVQYSSNGSSWTDASVLKTPTTNAPMFVTFTSASYRYWRLVITSTGSAPFIGLAFIGQALELDRAVGSGFILPHEAHDDKYVNQVSEGGQFLGRSVIRQGVATDLVFTLQTLTFVRGAWRTFVEHAKLRPWFFAWNPAYSDDAILAWMEGNPRPAAYSSASLLDVGVSIRGIRD